MWVAVLAVVVAALVVGWLMSRPASSQPRPSLPDVGAEAQRLRRKADAAVPEVMREAEAHVERMRPEVEAEAARMHAETMREVERHLPPIGPEFPKLDDAPVTLGPNGGPTWMFEDEWAEKVAAYRGQGRTAEEIREIAEYLARRGPRWPPTCDERRDRAERLGIVIREEYMSPEHEAVALEPDQDGFPDAWLERVRDRLLVVTPDGWVNPKSPTAASRAGIWSFTLRGTVHHESAALRGDFTPGARVRLVREPDNPHDPNAIAVYAEGTRNLAGYVPRGYAKRLAKVLDSGADMVAVSTRGARPGHANVSPQVLAVGRALWDHLNRERATPPEVR